MTIIPMGDRVLLEKAAVEEKTASGLILAASAKEESNIATVLAAGEDAPKELKKGVKVIFSKFAGTEFDLDGKACLLVESKEILAIVK